MPFCTHTTLRASALHALHGMVSRRLRSIEALRKVFVKHVFLPFISGGYVIATEEYMQRQILLVQILYSLPKLLVLMWLSF